MADDVEVELSCCSGEPSRYDFLSVYDLRTNCASASSKVGAGWKVGLSEATGAYDEYLWGGGGGGGESLSEFGEAMRLSVELRLSQLFIGGSMPVGGRILMGSAWNVRFSESSERPAVSR